MGSKKKPTQRVADYMLSIHFGIAHVVDVVKRVRYNEKAIWKGSLSENSVTNINLPDLFGGPKKEGGVRGRLHVLMGEADQTLSSYLAAKLKGTPETVPGFRGITSLFFTGGGPESSKGFYWGSNSGYIRAVDAEVMRAPKGFYPEKAMLPRTPVPPMATSGYLFAHTMNLAGTSPEYNPAATSQPTWNDKFSQTINFGTFLYKSGYSEYSLVTNQVDGSTWFRWTIPGMSASYKFDPRLKYFAEFNGANGLNWMGWSIGDPPTPNQIPAFDPDMPTSTIRVIGVNGVVYAEVIFFPLRTPWSSQVQPAKCFVVRIILADGTDVSTTVSTTTTGSSCNANIEFSDGLLKVRAESAGDSPSVPKSLNVSIAVDPAQLDRIEISATERKYFSSSPTPADDNANRSTLEITEFTASGEVIDANPAHIIYESLTNNDWGLGLPASQIDTASFVEAADTLYDEGFGLSMAWSSQTTIESFINDVLGHIDGTYGIDPGTGKIFLKLIRGGYSTVGLFHLNDDNCRITRFQRKAIEDTTNEVVVTWTNPETEQEETVVVHDLANYSQQGKLVSSGSNYYGVRYAELALRLGMRDLGRGSYPIASIEVDANRQAAGLRSGDVVLLSSSEYGIVELPIRITAVNYGRPGAMKVQITAVEDVFVLPDSAYVDVTGSQWEEEAGQPPLPVGQFTAGSSPYYLLTRSIGTSEVAGLDSSEEMLAFLVEAPNTDTRSFDLYAATANALGTLSYESLGTLELSSRAVLSADLAPQVTTPSFPVSAFTGSNPTPGDLLLIGDIDTGELCVVNSVDPLVVKRGVLDTVPGQWLAGTQVWVIRLDTTYSDGTERLVGTTSTFKLLPRTSQGLLDASMASPVDVIPVNRVDAPYRPANVRVNGALWPLYVEGTIDITWSRRNRLTEDPVVLAWDAADTAPEVGSTVTLQLFRVDTGALITEATGVTGTSATLTSTYEGAVRLEVFSIRDGVSSLRKFQHTFEYTTTQFRLTAEGDYRIAENSVYRSTEA